MPKAAVALLVGTKKGAFIFRSTGRRARWKVEGPYFRGGPVYQMAFDPRDGRSIWAAVNRAWGGPTVELSRDLGKTWKTVSNPGFHPDQGLTLKRVWHIEPGHPSQPGVVWAGVEPAGLFRIEYDVLDWPWTSMIGLNEHPTRDRWEPGGGGLALHSIAIDAGDPKHIAVGISSGGAYESRDGGASWRPWNQATRAEHLPEKRPDIGQCVHKLLAHAVTPGVFFQRNHFGVYWRKTGEGKWLETSEGLPSDYGFAAAMHPEDPKTAYVIPLDDHNMRMTTRAIAVYRTTDRGETWKRLDKGIPRNATAEVMREGLSTDQLDPLGIYFGTVNGELWGSADEGKSWTMLAEYLPPVLSVSTATLS